jgi:hypothetical protein
MFYPGSKIKKPARIVSMVLAGVLTVIVIAASQNASRQHQPARLTLVSSFTPQRRVKGTIMRGYLSALNIDKAMALIACVYT